MLWNQGLYPSVTLFKIFYGCFYAFIRHFIRFLWIIRHFILRSGNADDGADADQGNLIFLCILVDGRR